MTPEVLKEFKRLMREASEVASGDEYYELVFTAAAKLASGEWTPPAEREFTYDPAAMFPFATSRHTMTD